MCPICHDGYRKPTFLPCKHIFCEDCLAMWLDRERTCPMCRSTVAEDPKWKDGSTTYLVQLFWKLTRRFCLHDELTYKHMSFSVFLLKLSKSLIPRFLKQNVCKGLTYKCKILRPLHPSVLFQNSIFRTKLWRKIKPGWNFDHRCRS